MEAKVARLDAWREGHEELCKTRDLAMGREIRELKNGQADTQKALGGLTKGAWGVVLALLAWSMGQLYAGVQRQQQPPQAVAIAAAPPAAPAHPAR